MIVRKTYATYTVMAISNEQPTATKLAAQLTALTRLLVRIGKLRTPTTCKVGRSEKAKENKSSTTNR